MLHRLSLVALSALLVLALALPAMAGSKKFETRGTVESVDPAAKTFVVKDHYGKTHNFKVTEHTELEVDHKSDKKDEKISLDALKTGDSVKVKAYKGESPYAVRDVEIYR